MVSLIPTPLADLSAEPRTVAHNELLTEVKAFAKDSHSWRMSANEKLKEISATSNSTANRVSKATWMIAGAGVVFSFILAVLAFIVQAERAGVTIQ